MSMHTDPHRRQRDLISWANTLRPRTTVDLCRASLHASTWLCIACTLWTDQWSVAAMEGMTSRCSARLEFGLSRLYLSGSCYGSHRVDFADYSSCQTPLCADLRTPGFIILTTQQLAMHMAFVLSVGAAMATASFIVHRHDHSNSNPHVNPDYNLTHPRNHRSSWHRHFANALRPLASTALASTASMAHVIKLRRKMLMLLHGIVMALPLAWMHIHVAIIVPHLDLHSSQSKLPTPQIGRSFALSYCTVLLNMLVLLLYTIFPEAPVRSAQYPLLRMVDLGVPTDGVAEIHGMHDQDEDQESFFTDDDDDEDGVDDDGQERDRLIPRWR